MSDAPPLPTWLLARLRWATARAREARPEVHSGDAQGIARATVEARWQGEYYAAGALRPREFSLWAFHLALDGLLHLEQRARAEATLDWVLARFQAAGQPAPLIDAEDGPFALGTEPIDPLCWLLRSVERLDAGARLEPHREWIQGALWRLHARCFDLDSGDLRKDRCLPSLKPSHPSRGLCATVCILVETRRLARAFGFEVPELAEDLELLLKEWYWTGAFYRDDSFTYPPRCSAEANLLPYWLGLSPDREARLASSVSAVLEHALDVPMLLKDRRDPPREAELAPFDRLCPSLYADAPRSDWALLWIELRAELDPAAARRDLAALGARIAAEGTLWEAWRPDGEGPLRGATGFGGEQGALWIARWPWLEARLDGSLGGEEGGGERG